MTLPNSMQDEIFQKFNFDTEWAVNLISRLTDDEDVPIVGPSIMKQVCSGYVYHCGPTTFHLLLALIYTYV